MHNIDDMCMCICETISLRNIVGINTLQLTMSMSQHDVSQNDVSQNEGYWKCHNTMCHKTKDTGNH